MDLGSTDTSMKEDGKRGMEIPRDSEKTYSVMTKSGMQKLTEEEIKQGRKDGTIKRSLAKEALEEIEDERKTEQILGKRGRVIGEAPAAPTKVSTETAKRGRVIGEAPAAPTKISTETGKRGRVIGEAPAAPVKTAAEKETEKQIVADMKAGATPEEAVEKAMKVRKEGLADGTIEGTGAPVKVAGSKRVTAREGAAALEQAEKLQSEIDALKAQMKSEMGSVFDPENVAKFKEGLDLTTDEGKAEAKARRDKFLEDQSVFTKKIDALKEQKDKVMQTVDAGLGGPDDFEDTGSDDDFYSTRETGAKPTKVTGGTVVTGGGFTVKTESAEAKAARESAVDKEKQMLEAKKKAFALLEQQGVIGSDEFLERDDPRMQQVNELAQKIVAGDLKPTAVGGAQEMENLSNNMSSANTKMMDDKAESSTASVNAVNVSDSSTTVNSTTVNTAPMPSPMDKSDRSTQGAYRGRKI